MIVLAQGLFWLLRFAAGACAFSFFNVVIYRFPLGESVVRGRSRCMECGRILTAAELIPCVSYLMQRGRCKNCGEKISLRHPLMELAGGAAFCLCGARFGYGAWGLLSLQGLTAFFFLGILSVIAWIDWDRKMIYDQFPAMIAFLGSVALWLFPEHGLTDRLIGAVIVALPMLLLAFAVEGAFGGGDIKLMAAGRFFLGWRSILVAMLIGLVTGAAYCVSMLWRGRMARKDSFAFGPFLAIGLTTALFWGDMLAGWYLAVLR